MKKRTKIARAKAALKKPLLIMKLTLLLAVFCTFHASAGLIAQNISFKANDTEISKVLNEIQKQGDYRFIYNSSLKDLKHRISVNFVKADLEEALNQIFTGTTLTFIKLDNNLIAIRSTDPGEKDIRITGRVTTETGDPITAASIVIKGTKNGTVTDVNGNFSITVPDNAVLLISAVGYNPVEISVSGKQQITVKLEQSTKKMDEVVVIGYGQASKRDLTGSITKISGRDVADKPNTNPVASLQGKVSGLSVVNSGELGKEPDIRIRGTISKTQTKPLYIVDGIFQDNLDYVNPADIESIEVLKDPSSLAIFGVRGANGVIVVTSRKGKSGFNVNLSTSVGVKTMVDKIKLVDAEGFKTLYQEQLANAGNSPFNFSKYTGNTDWQDAIKQNGSIFRTNLGLSSGTETNKFYMGIGYQDEGGIIKHERLQKYILSLTDELRIGKNFKVGFDVNTYRSNNPYLQSFGAALIATPVINPYNAEQGLYNQLPIGTAQIANPLRVVEETQGTQISNTNRIVGNVFTEFSFLKSFTFRANYYADFSSTDFRSYSPLVNTWNIDNAAVSHEVTKTSVTQSKSQYSKYQQEYLLTYKKKIEDHSITVLGGFTTNYNGYTENKLTGSQFTTGLALPIPNDKRQWYVDNRTFVDPTSIKIPDPDKDAFGNYLPYQWEQATVSYLARALYNYKGKYMLNASFRRDGSSDIANDNRYQNFGAVGAAWEISKEGFMTDQKIFNFLKLKTSWGVLGNQYTSIHYPFYPLLNASNSAVFGSNGGALLSAYTPSFIPDPNLKWETVSTYEIGIEWGVLNNRLTGEFNYYNKTTKNLLTDYPGASGQKPGITNAGTISNKGIELSVNWTQPVNSNFSYNIGANLTTFKNKVTDLYGGREIISGPSITRVGDPIGSFYGYVVTGVVQDKADSAASPKYSGMTVGKLKYQDITGANGTPDGQITDLDRVIIGNPTPKFSYGISLGTQYKGLDFSMDIQGVYGNKIFRSWGNTAGYATFNYRVARLNRWHGAGTSNTEPLLKDETLLNSTYMIENGSYFRIRNVQIGYTFKAKSLSKVHIKSLRFYAAGQNLKTFKHNSGYTPEFSGSAIQFGVDAGSYPVPAVYTFGINANF